VPLHQGLDDEYSHAAALMTAGQDVLDPAERLAEIRKVKGRLRSVQRWTG
jgi:hypothetical protein